MLLPPWSMFCSLQLEAGFCSMEGLDRSHLKGKSPPSRHFFTNGFWRSTRLILCTLQNLKHQSFHHKIGRIPISCRETDWRLHLKIIRGTMDPFTARGQWLLKQSSSLPVCLRTTGSNCHLDPFGYFYVFLRSFSDLPICFPDSDKQCWHRKIDWCKKSGQEPGSI